ncbi:MAG: hypothetical protein OEX02_14855, partial [Cyclobacteriaceae bacterium]|nr:hypothetical protein [Cyclobacteriaceae bacterium]
PKELPGDSTGQVEVIAKIQESELYGNVETSELINWGIITAINPDIEKRSLWASGANAPISLIVLTTSLIIAVWGIIFYIVYKLYKLRST